MRDHLKISSSARFGAGFIAACGVIGLAGAHYALFVKNDDSVKKMGVKMIILMTAIYLTGFIAIKGRLPKLPTWISKKLEK